MERDVTLEAELLARAGGPAGYGEEVLARVNHSQAIGLEGWAAGLDELLAEAQQEAADISGWSLGAARKLPPELSSRLTVAMALAAASWRELQDLREVLAAAVPRPGETGNQIGEGR